jgi:hypothetical protein
LPPTNYDSLAEIIPRATASRWLAGTRFLKKTNRSPKDSARKLFIAPSVAV